MAAGAAFGVDLAGVVVRAEVVVAGGGVGEQVPDGGEDGAGDRDEGFELPPSFDQAPVANRFMGPWSPIGHRILDPGTHRLGL